jgi:diketogulonate reductase-like aldo/keto reductase
MIYNNENAVGKAIKDSGIPREEIFVTTKLWNTDQGYVKTKAAFELSLEKLGLDYVDLYLIHWFKGYENDLDSWRAMEDIYKEGKAKAIGVSNHNVHHLMNIMQNCEVSPMINQVETHIELQNDFLVEYCQENGIKVEAYAPLMSWRVSEMLKNETMVKIAKEHNKTVPQVAIKWLNQRGIIALPKSVNQSRIEANFDVEDFELTTNNMAEIKALNKGNKMFPEFDNIGYLLGFYE